MSTSFNFSHAQSRTAAATPGYEKIYTNSRVEGLRICILHSPAVATAKPYPVLFVHGSSFPSEMSFGFRMQGSSWMDVMAHQGFDCYALDFLGYGGSDRYSEMKGPLHASPEYSRGANVSDDVDRAVDEILRRTGAKSVFLVGHSWGATVCAYYAGRHPDKVKRLVLYAPFIQGAGTETILVDHAYHDMLPYERVRQLVDLAPKGDTSPLEPEITEEWGKQWAATDPSATTRTPASVRFPSGWEIDWQAAENGKCYYDPSKITMPVLLIKGEWDSSISDEDAARLFKNLNNAPDKRYVVISKGTHVLHLEKSRWKLYSEVNNFLDEEFDKQQKTVAVIFEVIPKTEHVRDYLNIAAELKPQLEKIDGFISIERFESLSNPGKILSLSFWRDEASVRKWRNFEAHRAAQAKGRKELFKDYRLRVVQVIRDYGMQTREEVPTDARQ